MKTNIGSSTGKKTNLDWFNILKSHLFKCPDKLNHATPTLLNEKLKFKSGYIKALENNLIKGKVSDKWRQIKEESAKQYYDNNIYDDYGSSKKKYGGYNGYSDDVIDDAFEGDPTATWNVD